ncbi:MAG: hypothetical protein APR63_09600 [Desulfuromonas sp. SDB]|nr:MAG: hypothetical protein APR63_09600 [Desulfuromonas sp. SDB]
MEHNNIWEILLKELYQETPPEKHESLDLWFGKAKPIDYQEQQLTVEVPNSYIRDWIDQNYKNILDGILFKIMNEKIDVLFISDEVTNFPKTNIKVEVQEEIVKVNLNIDNRYTFDNFVIGKNNQFCHAVAYAVSNSPGTVYNPLFLYGGVGLGKTHILNAIGNYVISHKRNIKVMITPAEMFANDLIDSIKKGKQNLFREKYRNLNVLLIDDIQSLVRWDSAQDEFFYTFNSLYSSQNQIVMTSDRPPKEIPKLHERLVSRFQQGMMAQITAPDLETRMAILKNFADRQNIHDVQEEVVYYIAQKVKDNVRVLEGALIRLSAFSNLLDKPIDLKMAHEIINDMIGDDQVEINIEYIQRKVADYYDLSESAMKGKRRKKSISLSRHVAMYLARELTDLPLKEIGGYFGGKDHSTVIHAIKKVEKLISEDHNFHNEIEKLKKIIKNN